MDGFVGLVRVMGSYEMGRVISCEGVFVNDQWAYVFFPPRALLGGVVDGVKDYRGLKFYHYLGL